MKYMPAKTAPTNRNTKLLSRSRDTGLSRSRCCCSSAKRRGRSTRMAPASPATMTTNQMEYLPKNIFHLVEQAARFGLIVNRRRAPNLFQEHALSSGQLGWGVHSHFHEQIAFSRALQRRQSFAADAERGSALRAFRDFQLMAAV